MDGTLQESLVEPDAGVAPAGFWRRKMWRCHARGAFGIGMSYLGFERQLGGTCSRFSIRHSLLCLGIPTTELSISLGMRRPRFWVGMRGASEQAILSALRAHGTQPVVVWERRRSAARQRIDGLLKSGAPCIIGVSDTEGNAWAHWHVLSGRRGGSYYWIDSADKKLAGCWSAAEILDCMEAEGEDRPYYAIGVRPRRAVERARSLVPRFSRFWDAGIWRSSAAARKLRRSWGWRLADLGEVFRHERQGVSAARFIDAHRGAILEAASGGRRASKALATSLDAYRLVADAHGMRVAPRRRIAAATQLAQLLAGS